MAAGRPDVSRGREYCSYGYSKKEVVHYKSGTHDAKSSRGGHDHKRKSGYNILSNGHSFGPRGGESRFDDAPRVMKGEVSRSEDGVQFPPEKKTKFSPVIWDLEDKKVRISSKNRIVRASSILSHLKPPAGSVVSDGGVAENSISENQVKGLEPLSDKPLVVGEMRAIADAVDQVQFEEEEFVPAQSISTSRWSSDADTPKDVPKREEQGSKKSTPESGEFCRETSEDRAVLSGSDHEMGMGYASKDEYSDNELEDDVIDIDKTPVEDTGTKQLQIEEPAFPTQRNMDMLQGCRSVFEFERLNKISEGTYGIVYRAKDKKTGEIVALKKVKMNVGRKEDYLEYGFPLSSLREINILLSFNHPSIVNVKEIVMGDHDSVFMVMEYMEHDLKGLMESMRQPFSTSEVKCVMLQLLEGVKYLHDNWVLHRDLKTSNILLSNQGELKICDFGMSRQYGSPLKPYTSLVVTLWYRAPELLLGSKKYSTAVDMWSVGCIMAELLAKKALFPGTREVEQIDKIFKTLGTPTESIWPGFSELPGAKANYTKQPYNLLRKLFPAASFTGSPVLSELGYDLLNKFLTYDPEKRITVDEALNHDWFREVPLPKSKEFMPTFPPQHARSRYVQRTLKNKEEFELRRCSDEGQQQNKLLYAPCHKDALTWHGCDSKCIQA